MSNEAREILRFCANGQNPSMQFSKLAAAARMAEAFISGWPEEPSSPVHSRSGAGATGAGVLTMGELTTRLGEDGGSKREQRGRCGGNQF